MRPLRCSARVSSRTARHDDVAAAAVHLEHLERLRQVHQRTDVADRADVDLAAGQESDGAAEVDGEAALHSPEDHALDAVAGLEFLFELVPGGFAAGTVARQHRFAGAILDPVDIDLDLVADLELRFLAGSGELAKRHSALALQSDVDHRKIILDARDDALHHLAFEGFVLAAEAFVEELREIVAGRECRGRHKVCCLSSSMGPRQSTALVEPIRACRVPCHHGRASHADLVACTAAGAPCSGGVRRLPLAYEAPQANGRVAVPAGTGT